MTQTSTSKDCPCGSQKAFAACCEPFLEGKSKPATAEALMRSRYSAYVKGAISYLSETLLPETRQEFDEASVAKWSRDSEWKGLEIVKTEGGGASDSTGTVEFKAHYKIEGKDIEHHEVADFKREDGRWYFVDGRTPKTQPIRRDESKVGRNDPCPCGSGKKYKKCHGANA